jgi:hypothetical protein
MQQVGRVGTNLDARADLSQFRSLFEDLNVQAGAPKHQCRRQPADARAHHDDSHVGCSPLSSADGDEGLSSA